MRRYLNNQDKQFFQISENNMEDTRALLSERRKESIKAWDDLDQAWRDLDERVLELGISRSFASNESMVQLNVGGSHVNFYRSCLEGMEATSSIT